MNRKWILGFLLLFALTINLFGPIDQQSIGMVSCTAITAYAASDSGILDIEDGDDGMTIGPGEYPSLNGDLEDTVKEANGVLERYKNVGNFILAVILLALLAVLIINITSFAASVDDERTRRQAMIKILLCGISISLIGGITIIVSLTQNLFLR